MGLLRDELEKVKQEKEGFEFKIAKFDKSAKDLEQLLASQITDKSKKGFGYNAVPSPHPLILNRPTPLDLSYSKIDDSLEQHQKTEPKLSSVKSSLKEDKDWKEKFFCPANHVRKVELKKVRENNDAPIIEDWVLDDEDDDEPNPKDETSEILKIFIKEVENLVDKKVKIIRSDNGTEFKNKVMDDFCREKEIVLIVKPHNKTPYELFRGFKPAIGFMKPFGCHVTILNTLDKLGKFDGKSDEGFFVGYSLSSKAFRVSGLRIEAYEKSPEDSSLKIMEEPKRVSKALHDPAWVEAMAGVTSHFKLQKSLISCGLLKVSSPKTSHLLAVKRIFRYLKGKPSLGLWYSKDSPWELVAYTDSDYAGATQDRKSTTRGCQFLGNRLISWQCKKQTVVATSTTEAEYVAAANCCGQIYYKRTAEATNDDNGEVQLTAIIDGHLMTITEASLRRHLKLDDHDGITSIPNSEIFEQLALMGYHTDSDKLTFQKGAFYLNGVEHSPDHTTAVVSFPSPTQPTQPSPETEQHIPTPHGSPLYAAHSHGNDEGSLKLIELTNLVTKLSERIDILEDDLKKTKLTYSAAITKLILRVKKLEFQVKTRNQERCKKRRSEEERTRKDKGKAIMTEPEPKKKSKKELEQERLSFAEATDCNTKYNEEQRAQNCKDKNLLTIDEEERKRATTEAKTTK
ncbi:uncharacterized mitochondrial protein-like protein [Tanacetum coccineum]